MSTNINLTKTGNKLFLVHHFQLVRGPKFKSKSAERKKQNFM